VRVNRVGDVDDDDDEDDDDVRALTRR